jgi:hypothetical protein
MSDSVADAIFAKYRAAYDSELQGCCLLIADEISRAVGGEVVAGELTWYGGSCRRTHWWVERNGQVIDPMGDDFLRYEEGVGRQESHRDRAIFNALLPRYERWRVAAEEKQP